MVLEASVPQGRLIATTRPPELLRPGQRPASRTVQGRRQKPIACPRVPSMGRILLDERSQPEPMRVTAANHKAQPRVEAESSGEQTLDRRNPNWQRGQCPGGELTGNTEARNS